MNVLSKYIVGLAYLIAFFAISFFIASFTVQTDFPVFYSTAKTVIENGIFTDIIYDIDENNKYAMPEHNKDLIFIYSKPAAILLSPLGFLPYHTAKSVLIFVNILCYLFGIHLILNLTNIKDNIKYLFCGASFFYMPFIQVLRLSQVDGILFFFIAAGLWFCVKNKPWAAGFCLAIATFFKIFPIAIAFALGIKNRKILYISLLIFFTSFLMPNSHLWFSSIPGINEKAFSPIYLYLYSKGIWLYYIYFFIISTITAFFVLSAKENQYFRTISLVIPGLFLVTPLVEYQHLTICAISFICAFDFLENKYFSPFFYIIVLSVILISSSIFIENEHIKFLGIFLIWSIHVYTLLPANFPIFTYRRIH